MENYKPTLWENLKMAFWASAFIAGAQIYLVLMGVMAGLPSPSLSDLMRNLGTTAIAWLVMSVAMIVAKVWRSR